MNRTTARHSVGVLVHESGLAAPPSAAALDLVSAGLLSDVAVDGCDVVAND